MRNSVEIENIEEMRRSNGIDDVELREEIGRLQVGDAVKLTFRTSTKSAAWETLLVRITSIRGSAFRGKVAKGPTSASLSNLRVGSPVVFTAAHIHSLGKEQATHES